MRSDWRAVLAILAVVMTGAVAIRAEVIPPPLPPAGWDEHVAPGFTPSVESIVILLSDERYVRPVPDDRDAKLAAYWNGWGRDGVPVVTGIYEDPQWSKFASAALELLFASPFPEATDYVKDRIRKLVQKSDREKEEVQELGTLCHRLAHYRPEEAWPFFREMSATEDEETLHAVAYALLLMKTEESVTEAKSIIARLPESKQKQLTRALEFFEAQMRAHEPMERILRKEREDWSIERKK